MKINSNTSSEDFLGPRCKSKMAWHSSVDWVSNRKNSKTSTDREDKKKSEEKRINDPSNLFDNYIKNGSIHGLKYIFDPELYNIERFLWFIFVVISIVFTVKTICKVSADFQAAPTITVIESTNYKVSGLPFPSITICPRDRVDWRKVMGIEAQLIPSNKTKSVQLFRNLMTSLSSLSFARFDEMLFLKNVSFDGLEDINITDVLLNVVPSCEDILSSCWWRYAYHNCCEIFALQKTEHGFCYSFNSATSENWNQSTVTIRRTSGFGEKSGLKVTLHLANITSPPSHLIRGATLFVEHPNVWPSSGQAIAAGMALSVNVQCTSGYATTNVLSLGPGKIPCKYSEGLAYSQETCISNCRKDYIKKYCNCNPSYFFQTGGAPDCKIKDFICLIEHNGNNYKMSHNTIFTNYQIPGDNRHILPDEPIMYCDCPPACDFYHYDTRIASIPMSDENELSLEVHFEHPTSIRYRMEVVLNGQNLLVSFGGIFGLFVGGSILTVVEFVYTCFVALFSGLYLYVKTKKKKITGQERMKENLKIYSIPSLRPKIKPQTACI